MSVVVKKKIKPGKVEPDDSELALIVFYDKEVTYDDDRVDRTRHSTRVRLKALDISSDIPSMAASIVNNCKYLTASRQKYVEQALVKLQRRNLQQAQLSDEREKYDQGGMGEAPGGMDGEASVDKLDEYLEMMYETGPDMTEKVRGTAMILQLCFNVGNLEVIVGNQAIMSLLGRLFKDEFRKSMEMCYNIMRIYLSLSNFLEMHPVLASHNIGRLSLIIMDYENTRIQHQLKEMKRLDSEAAQGSDADISANSRQRAKAKLVFDRSQKIVYACSYLLINLAEDIAVERKMLKKKLIALLGSHMNSATSSNLLVMLIAFMKKLSTFEENTKQIAELELLPTFVNLVSCDDDNVALMVLRLIYNLSFDPKLKYEMVKCSILPKLVRTLQAPKFRGITLKILYHLSMDDRVKSMIGYTEATPLIMQLVLKFPGQMLAKELGALAVNISFNMRVAEMMCHFPKTNRGLYELVERVRRTHDPILMKVIRNISEWTYSLQEEMTDPKNYPHRGMWGRFIDKILEVMIEGKGDRDLLVEVLGCLCNLTPLDLHRGKKWSRCMEEYDLLSFLSRLLVPHMADRDVVLMVVIYVGALSLDETTVPIIASSSSKLIYYLQGITNDYSQDPEVLLQLLFTFKRLLCYKDTREEILYGSNIVDGILASSRSKHTEIRNEADACLSIIHEHDRELNGPQGELAQQVCKLRYSMYNREWLDEIQRSEQGAFTGSMYE
eukprot:CAMPEP_0185777364 /NCGR_PEP_ID=MMETSP1174-20130828/89186_1 /TAXON_ID=35687 /ORGANISM="Dictyocha speculum, Strain CCMP1381" /LENGTH=723 /DNA_ID=CAMNT_0028465709 /DNA_START=106 /DNA_END=2274 /DNA_ORIENTATION=+